MSVQKKEKGVYEVRWREGGRHKSAKVHGTGKRAKTVEHKKLTLRDENRYLDVKKEINYSMSDLIDRYWTHYGRKKASADREKSIVEGIRTELGRMFVREVDGIHVQHWYENLTGKRGLAENTAVRHFNVMHHLMKKASTIWSKECGHTVNLGEIDLRAIATGMIHPLNHCSRWCTFLLQAPAIRCLPYSDHGSRSRDM
jgi:hypothetical protein